MDDDNNTGERFDRYSRPPRRNPIGCRLIGCGCLLLILIICLLSVFLIVAKPQTIWGYITDFVNAGLETREYIPIDTRLVQNRINSQINDLNDIEIVLSEDEITSLAQEVLPSFKNLVLDLKDDKIFFTWDLFDAAAGKPLKGVAELTLTNNTLDLTRLGTNRFDAPDFLKKFIAQMFFSKLNLGSEGLNDSFLGSVFSSSQVSIDSLSINDFEMKIDGKIKVDLFD